MFTNEQILSVAREYLQVVLDGNLDNASVCVDENEIHVYHHANNNFIYITDVSDCGLEGVETVTDTGALITICSWIKSGLLAAGFKVETQSVIPLIVK